MSLAVNLNVEGIDRILNQKFQFEGTVITTDHILKLLENSELQKKPRIRIALAILSIAIHRESTNNHSE